jgi:hypothetical protein
VKTQAPLLVLFLLLLLSPPAVAGQESAGPEPPDAVSISGLFYLTYEDMEIGGRHESQFFIHRAYLTTRVDILPRLSGRLTFDTSQDMEGDGQGDMEVRLKYAYAEYAFGDWGPVRGARLEAGIVHMVWLAFEEHINRYRMRGPMFLERSGIFNSADFGATLNGGFGPELPAEYRNTVSSAYASRYGSFAVGVYNGTGYHGDERNRDKVVQGRLSLRPLPAVIPGLQLSGLAIVGKGNRSAATGGIPDWRTYDLFLSYQHRHGTLAAQYMWGEGNQRGTWVEPLDPGAATDHSGYSFFGEGRLGPHWRLIGGLDRVDRVQGGVDRSFWRVHGGFGYDLGRENVLLFDVDHREWDAPVLRPGTRYRLVFQVKF